MSIEIDNLMYKFEDEELDEIEYLEIMSLDDIIKDNPSFIALSRNDIQDNLYNMFLNKKKAENIVKLFYEIIDDNNKKRGLLNNYDNYIFNVEAEKKENDLQYNKDPEDANYFLLKLCRFALSRILHWCSERLNKFSNLQIVKSIYSLGLLYMIS